MSGRFLSHYPRNGVRLLSAQLPSALKIVLCYVLFGCLWILYSDVLLSRIVSDNEALTRMQTLKGWMFIIITAFMLYALIAKSMALIEKSDAALNTSAARLGRVVESNMIGIVFWNVSGQVIDGNDAFLEVVGYTREDLLAGKINWKTMTPVEQRRFDEHAIKELSERGRCSPFEREYIRKDGSRVSVLIGAATLKEDAGTHIAFVLDVTKRKQVERALRESERQLWEILENIQLLSLMFDVDGLLMYCNEYLLNLTGWHFEDVIGRNWFDTFVPPEERELIRFTFTEMLKKGMSPTHIEYEIERRNGERRIISWNNTVLRDLNGKAVGITGIGEDITERKRSEDKFQAAYEESRALSAHLQSAREEERIRIAREIHDVLGQALTSLKMDVWWLIKRLEAAGQSPPKETQLEMLKSMSQLIDETIVSVRKLATELRPGVLDDLGLVTAIEWQAKEFQARTGIICHLHLPAEDIEFEADESTAVFRIFQEVLTNVVRHANARHVEVRMREDDGTLELVVRDDGRGIPMDKISGKGSLGLLGMRERAQLFGGEVIIRQGRERGTVVTVKIPVRSRHRPADRLSKAQRAM